MTTKTKAKIPAPVDLLVERKLDLEYVIKNCDKEIRAAARKGERVATRREAYLIELKGVEEAIEKLGGVPADA